MCHYVLQTARFSNERLKLIPSNVLHRSKSIVAQTHSDLWSNQKLEQDLTILKKNQVLQILWEMHKC